MTVAAMKPAPRNFTLAMTLLIVGTIFFGFSFTIWPGVLARTRPAVLYLHALTAPGFLILLVAQVMLVRRGKVALHRRVGVYGLWLGALASATAFATALILRYESVVVNHPGDRTIERTAFLAVPLAGFVCFTVALALAAWWRGQPAFHRRAMMIAAVSMMDAGIARIPVLGDLPYFGDVVSVLFVVAFCAQDWRMAGRLHPVYQWGLPLFVGVETLSQYLSTQHPAWWVATARWMIGA
jgi:uncharacterized membrane protein YozB (DUF420 family)